MIGCLLCAWSSKNFTCVYSQKSCEVSTKMRIRIQTFWDLPGGLVVRIPGFHHCGPGSIPGQGTENPVRHSVQQKKKKKKKDILKLREVKLAAQDHTASEVGSRDSDQWAFKITKSIPLYFSCSDGKTVDQKQRGT